jgi:hypothetical protein
MVEDMIKVKSDPIRLHPYIYHEGEKKIKKRTDSFFLGFLLSKNKNESRMNRTKRDLKTE